MSHLKMAARPYLNKPLLAVKEKNSPTLKDELKPGLLTRRKAVGNGTLKDGTPNIYIMDLSTKELKVAGNNFSIDTEPAWMPDGQSLVFTSNRGGKPQIYQVDLKTGQEKRLTFDGDYNAGARVMPDGSGLIL